MQQLTTSEATKIGKIVIVDGTRHTLPASTNPALLNDDRAICRAIAHAMRLPALAEADVIPSHETIDGEAVPVITLRTQPPTKGLVSTPAECLREIPPARLVDGGVVKALESWPITIAEALESNLAASIDRVLQPNEGRHALWLGITNLASVAADLDGGIGF